MLCAPTANIGCMPHRHFSLRCYTLVLVSAMCLALLGVGNGDGSVDACSTCHTLAFCNSTGGVDECECPEGLLGNGIGEAPSTSDLTPMTGCSASSWTVRFAINLGPVQGGTYQPFMVDGRDTERLDPDVWLAGRDQLADLYALAPADTPPGFKTSMYHTVRAVGNNWHLIVNAFFPTKSDAEDAAGNLDLNGQTIFGVKVDEEAEQDWAGYILSQPRVSSWYVETTDGALKVNPTGLVVDFVSFDISGCSAGCWRIDVTYTLGQNNWNIFYIPRTHEGSPFTVDSLSYDFQYPSDVTDTFEVANFPCRTFDYEPDESNILPDKITACCIPEFYSKYRVLGDPTSDPADGDGGPPPPYMCTGATGPPTYVAYADDVDEANGKYLMPGSYVEGELDFSGIAGGQGRMEGTQLMDPFVNQWRATVVIDEKELRNKAGLLTGTVGVEYTIDTFVGLAEFKPTGQTVLDSFARQTAIHLEKTDIMTAATHGTNEYTFLQYINLRLIEVLNEDVVYTDDEAASNFARTLRYEAAHYLQVTFTMGPPYRPKADQDLIPLDSVRVGYGPFITQTAGKGALHHACEEYGAPGSGNLHFKDQEYKDLFHRRFAHCVSDLDTMAPVGDVPFFGECPPTQFLRQGCAPKARMCANPEDTPDQFVVFNVPLGIDYLPPGSMFLDQKVHVSLVVQAENIEKTPEEGDMTKTTLTASVPVIPGGQNIFCDGIIGRADLGDIARAVVLVGSAHDESELSQILVLGEGDETIASSTLNPAEPQRVQAASIESGLMTLLVLGNDTYFDNADQRNSYRSGLVLEDVLTVHIMEDSDQFDEPGTLSAQVLALLREEGEQNYNENNELKVDGYRLNGAFHMKINRAEQAAELDPTAPCSGTITGNSTNRVCNGDKGLLWYCGWRLPAPRPGQIVRSGCIIRKDWSGREPNTMYPYGEEDLQSAMELPFGAEWLPTGTEGDDAFKAEYESSVYGPWRADTGRFMQSVLNAANYSAELGQDYAKLIEQRYRLNGRSRRAFWVNPAYTWTVAQTQGQDRFSLTQKIIMFALFNLNENFVYPSYSGPQRRQQQRRFLLQAGGESGDGLATISTTVIYATSPAQMLADAYGVPRRQVGSWQVGLQMTAEEACQTPEDMVAWGIETLQPMFEETASDFYSLQVTEARVDLADVECGLARRAGAEAFSRAVVELSTIVVFESSRPTLDTAALTAMARVYKLEEVGPPVVNQDWAEEVAGPKEEGGSESKAGMIGALVGVFGGVVLLGLGGWYLWKKRSGGEEGVQTAQAQGFGDVKLEMEAELQRVGLKASDIRGEPGKSEFADLMPYKRETAFEDVGSGNGRASSGGHHIDF